MPGSMMGELFGSRGAEGNISEGAEGTPVRATHPLTVEHVEAHSTAFPSEGGLGCNEEGGSIVDPSTPSGDDW